MPLACCLPKNAGIWGWRHFQARLGEGAGGGRPDGEGLAPQQLPILGQPEEKESFHSSRQEGGRPCLTLSDDLHGCAQRLLNFADFGLFFLAKFATLCSF